ncbi:MAG: rod shape-determining protein [Alkalicoccus sp.]|nr:MAG: rod shape-determining protein [Alkalicoccus sp.]
MFHRPQIGIDLGTVTMMACGKNKEDLILEPSLAAIFEGSSEPAAFGREALRLIQQKPSSFTPVQPIKGGTIADEKSAVELLAYILSETGSNRSLFSKKPEAAVCISTGATDVEKRAVKKALYISGAGRVRLIEEPLAAALGSGIPAEDSKAHMIVSIGGGKSEAAVMAGGRIILSNTARTGGMDLDEAFCRFMNDNHDLLISPAMAEETKLKVGTAPGFSGSDVHIIRGIDTVSGLPRSVEIHSSTLERIYEAPLKKILNAALRTLQSLPPETSGELLDRGVVLCGGGALLTGLAPWMSDVLQVPVQLSPCPVEAAVKGASLSFNSPEAERQL